MLSERTRGWIGIDLGTRAVKMAQVERVGARWRLAHARIFRRTPDDEARPALDWWIELCHRERLREGFTGPLAACVLPGSITDQRALQLPDGEDAERRAMVAAELETLYAGEMGRRSFDYWDSSPPVGDAHSNLENVNTVSVLEAEASAVAEALDAARLACQAIDGIPLALARAVRLAAGSEAGPTAVVDWGATTATFSILCGDRPVFTRLLRGCGFAAMPAAVSEALNLPREDAEQLLATYGLSDPDRRDGTLREIQEALADVTSGPLVAMAAELNKTLAYPELHRSRLIPGQIWLFGGGATVRNIGPQLSARVGVPVVAWQLPGGGMGTAQESSLPGELLGAAVALSALAWMQ
jgi:Tfp pilus assembly PilM family ATPase